MPSFITICILFVFLVGGAAASHASDNQGNLAPSAEIFRKDKMIIKTQTAEWPFSIEVAETPEQMAYGLMNRHSLPEDYAMLFMFPEDAIRYMWMKDTPLSLDMLFVDKHGRIVYIHPQATPYSTDTITSHVPARAVVEVLGGIADKKQIQTGDLIIHPYFTP